MMFGSIGRFIRRHRRKFVVVGVIAGGVYAAGKYLQWRMEEAHDADAAERLANQRMRQHFEGNQVAANATVVALLPTVKEHIMKLLDLESLTGQIREGHGEKLAMWESLKIISCTRTVVGIYAVCLVVLLERIQINIVGRHMYLDVLANLDDNENNVTSCTNNASNGGIPSEIQSDYLLMVEYFVQDGLKRLVSSVDRSVRDLLIDVSLKERFGPDDVRSFFSDIRCKLEETNSSHIDNERQYETDDISQQSAKVIGKSNSIECDTDGFASIFMYLFPSEADEVNVLMSVSSISQEEAESRLKEPALRLLLNETRELLASRDLVHVSRACMDTMVATTMDNITPFFHAKDINNRNNSSDDSNCDINESITAMKTLPLAKVIPIINGQIHSLFKPSSNEFVDALSSLPQLQEFSAIVYSAFPDNDYMCS